MSLQKIDLSKIKEGWEVNVKGRKVYRVTFGDKDDVDAVYGLSMTKDYAWKMFFRKTGMSDTDRDVLLKIKARALRGDQESERKKCQITLLSHI